MIRIYNAKILTMEKFKLTGPVFHLSVKNHPQIPEMPGRLKERLTPGAVF